MFNLIPVVLGNSFNLKSKLDCIVKIKVVTVKCL